MDEQFSIWYPVIIENQLDFEGHVHSKEVLSLGHILHNGRLLCKGSMEAIKNKLKVAPITVVKDKTVKGRVEKTRLCRECLKQYRANPSSAYAAWVEGKPKTHPAKLPELAKF